MSFLSRFLRVSSQADESEDHKPWSTVMIMHVSAVPVHRDHRNEWNTRNVVIHIPEQLQLWTGPSKGEAGAAVPKEPNWVTDTVQSLCKRAVSFDPRNYHAVRYNHGWVLVGYTPLGVHKVQEEDKAWLVDVGFHLPQPEVPIVEVKAFRPHAEFQSSSSSGSANYGSHAASDPPCVQSMHQDMQMNSMDINSDVQEDSVTAFIGWDPTGGNRSNLPRENLEETDMYEFLLEREVEWVYKRLIHLGVESPADLYYLYAEDLIEFGLSEDDAKRIMFGIHPEGMMRPDNPNGISLTTGEVRLLDRGRRPIPWAIQNRTLGLKKPGPPVPGLGVRGSDGQPDPYAADWTELVDPIREPPPLLPPQLYDVVDCDDPPSGRGVPPEISPDFSEEHQAHRSLRGLAALLRA